MLKVQNPIQRETTFSTLLSMGYKPETINLALEDSKNQSLDEVLELLLCNEGIYNSNPQPSNPQPNNKKGSNKTFVENIFEEFQNDNSKKRKGSGKGKNKNDNKNEEKKPVPKKDSFNQPNNQPNNQNNLNNPNNEDNKGGNPELSGGIVPKTMDPESALYMNTIRKSLNSIDSKDPNEYVITLSDHLKSLKFNTSELGQAVHKYLFSGVQFGQIIELRKKIYEVIMKVMTMKRQGEVNIQEFEYLLLMSFENRVLNVKQMDHILYSYNRFCTKAGYSQDDVLVSSLERYYTETKKAQALPNGSNFVQDMDSFLMTDIELMKCPNVTSVKQNSYPYEEFKASDVEVNKAGNKGKLEGRSEKEICIYCKERTREIVFLPCCHFLTCTACSPQITKCTICSKKVEKNLKIFWS